MYDLRLNIPELDNYSKVIIAAGGPSLMKYLDEITERVRTEDDTILFDVNQHYTTKRHQELLGINRLIISFSMDLGLTPDHEVVVPKLMDLPNSILVGRKPFSDLGNVRNIKPERYHAVPACMNYEIYYQFMGVADGSGGTLSFAYSLIPPNIDKVDIYACDSVILKDQRSVEQVDFKQENLSEEEKKSLMFFYKNNMNAGYAYYREINRPGIKFLSDLKNVTIHV